MKKIYHLLKFTLEAFNKGLWVPTLSLFLIANLILATNAFGQTNTWDGSGGANWNTASSWSLNHVPLATEDVVIPNGITGTIYVNTAAVCLTFTMNSGGTSNIVSISVANSLTVTNGVTIGTGTGFGDEKTLAVAGSLSCASLTISTAAFFAISRVTLSTGTVTVTGDLTMGNGIGINAFQFTGAGTLNVGGTISGGTLTPSTGTVDYNGSTQSVGAYTYNNLTFSGSGTKDMTGVSTIGGNFVMSGTSTTTATANLDINGSVTLGSSTGFTAGAFTHTVAGNWTNNGATFTNTNSTITLNGAAQTIGGTSATTFNNLTLAGSSTKTFGLATTIDATLSINTGIVANLGSITTHTANGLVQGAAGQIAGTWGSTASAAINQNDTYFTAAATGIVTTAVLGPTTYYSRQTGNWNNNTTWSTVTYGNATNAGTFPVAGNIVNIGGGNFTITVTADAACGSLNYQGNTSNSPIVSIDPGITLDVSGAIDIPSAPLFDAALNTLAVGDGILNTGSISFASINSTGQPTMTINTGTVTVSGDVTATSFLSTSAITFTGAGLLQVAGAFLNSDNATLTPSTGTVEYNCTVAQTMGDLTYNNLLLSGSDVKTASGALDINGSITLGSGTSFTAGAFTHTVAGDWVNNGDFNAQNGKIVFDGTTTQQVSGSATTIFNDIDLTNTAVTGLQVESNVNLQGVLTLSDNTTLDADGAGAGVFTIISNATNDARIAVLPSGASITGNLVFEKYFAGAGIKYWRHISSPVLGSTIADLQEEIPISGSFSGADNGNYGIPVGAYASLYYYDNAAAGSTLDDRWVNYPSSVNTELLTSSGTEARGYAVWTRDTGPVTFALKGQLNQGTIDLAPSGNNERWNLLGNPYPSDIDWDNAGWTKTDIEGNSIYIWNGSQYLEWNGSIGSLGNGRIAKGQAFWIKGASSSVGLVASEAVKSITSTSTFRTNSSDEPSYLDLTVSAAGYTDHAYIQFIDTAKFELDIADASKLENKIFNLATISLDSVLLAINAISGNACDFDIPIRLWNTWDDTYNLNWNLTPDLLNDFSISLIDNYTNETYDLTEPGDGFDFYISKDDATKESDRFMLHFATASIDSNMVIETNQNCSDQGNATINLSASQYGVDYTLWQDDQSVITYAGTGEVLVFEIDSTLLTIGTNSFLIRATRSSCTTQGVDFMVDFEFEIIEAAEMGIPISVDGCYNTSVTLMVWEPRNATSFRWYEDVSDKEPILETVHPEFETPILTEPKSYYVSAVNAYGCETERVEITAIIKPILDISNEIIAKDSICNTEDLLVIIDSSISKMEYFITIDKEVVSDTIIGNLGDIEIMVPTSNLTTGSNVLSVVVFNETCNEMLSLSQSINVYKSLDSVSSVESVVAENICNSGSSLIIANGANENEQYYWYNNADDISPMVIEQEGEFVTPILDQSRVFYVSIINETGCESPRRPIEVKVNQVPIPIVTTDIDDFNNYVLNSSYLKDNQWFFNNALLVGETEQTLKTVEPGYYSVQVNSGGCTEMSDSVEINNTVLAVGDLAEQVKISMYPNPATDKVMIDIPMLRNQAIQVMILSMDGKIQREVGLEEHENNTFVIDLRTYNPGTYILEVLVESTAYSYSLIIQ